VCFLGSLLGEPAWGQPIPDRPKPIAALLYYFPFDSYPTVGISEASIESDSIFSIQIITGHPRYQLETSGEHPFLKKLRNLLTRTPRADRLKQDSLSLKLKLPNETFLVDANGRVRRVETGELFSLSQEEMKVIDREIVYLAGIVDVRSIIFTRLGKPEKVR
jgi:hypothetical protein